VAVVSFKNIDGVPLERRTARLGNGAFRRLAQSALACLVVLVTLFNMPESVAETKVDSERSELKKEGSPVLGDPNYKLDPKYWPIYGSPRGKSFFLHYCFPGLVPQELGKCDAGSIPGSDPESVQVNYNYSLIGREAEHARLEGSAAFHFPFPVNVSLEGKTPYLEQYKRKAEISKWESHQVVKSQGELSSKYEGLDFYESPALPGGWWVPEDITEYRTKLGNPPMFVCGSHHCFLNLDQGNGWIVTAIFNEAALKDWRTFFVQLNESIKIIMEQ
jgi:hypothetical protein